MASPSMKAVVTPQPAPTITPGPDGPTAGGPPPGPALLPRRKSRLGGVQSRALYVRLCRASDPTVAVAALVGAFLVDNIGHMPGGLADFLAIRLTVKTVLLLAFFGILWRLVFGACGLYRWEHIRSVRSESWRIAAACTLAAGAALVFPLTTVSGAFEYHTVLNFWACTLLAVPAARLGMHVVASRTNLEDIREVVIVGRGPRAVKLWHQLQQSPDIGYRLLGFVDGPDGVVCPPEVRDLTLGTLDDFESPVASTPPWSIARAV